MGTGASLLDTACARRLSDGGRSDDRWCSIGKIYFAFFVNVISFYQPISEKVNLEEIPKTQS